MVDRKQFISIALGLGMSLPLSACTGVASINRNAQDEEEEVEEEVADDQLMLEDAKLVVATMDGDYNKVLKDFAKDRVAEQGLTISTKKFETYQEANDAVVDGDADACLCQRLDELNAYEAERQAGLKSAGTVFYRPFGVYSMRHDTLREAQQDTVIAIPNDPVGRSRALLLLSQEGLIVLNDPNRLELNTYDTTENPLGIQFREFEQRDLARQLLEVDYSILDASAEVNLEGVEGVQKPSVADAIVIEASDGYAAKQCASILATKKDSVEDDRIRVLLAALKSEEFAEYLQTNFGQELIPTA